jgi:hypothetical protein
MSKNGQMFYKKEENMLLGVHNNIMSYKVPAMKCTVFRLDY